MSTALLNRRFANATNDELIAMAIDEGFDSLAYALACRLEKKQIFDDDNKLNQLDSIASDIELSVSMLTAKINSLRED